MSQEIIDLSYIKEAYKLAQKSPDRSTQNGAILVRDNSVFLLNNILAQGFNDFPRGVIQSDERLSRPLKYSFTEHAERKVIYDAARKGVSTKGLIMYVPWFACAECGRAIIDSEIKEVVGFRGPERWLRERASLEEKAMDWKESIGQAIQMFDEAGVAYRWVDGKLGDIKVLFAEKFVYP